MRFTYCASAGLLACFAAWADGGHYTLAPDPDTPWKVAVRHRLEADLAFGADTRRCMSYWDEGPTTAESGRRFRLVAVRSECDRQGTFAPLAGRFAVLPGTGAIYYQDPAEQGLTPYNKWLRTMRAGKPVPIQR
jgi:hypothetical protein